MFSLFRWEREATEMEMIAVEDIGIGQDLTPPILPIAAALHDSSRFSHCSACFSPLHDSPDSHTAPPHFLRYCSRLCSSLDSPLHFSSAEFHLLRHPATPTSPETSDLRLSLRLLHRFETLRLVSRNDAALDRIGGMMTNRAELLRKEIEVDVETCEEYEEVSERIREGARAMAAARRMRDGLNLESSLAEDCAMEEAVLCLVLTNAVEVQDSTGCSVGVAVYGPSFSWINHSCSPNSSYRFSTVPSSGAASSWLIHPKPTDGDNRNGSELINTNLSLKFLSSLGIEEGYGPSLIMRSIKDIKKGEEVLITYTDLLQPKGMRRFELRLKYRFLCCCNRCNADPKSYVDHILEEVSFTSLGCSTSTITSNFCGDFNFTNKKLVARFDDAIDEFLASDNSISCCSELENLLTHGYPTETTCETLKLHPLHHLSLKAYTTLASAYKALASDLFALNPMSDKDNLKAFSFSKASAAYSLLLAGSTHHLFLFEPSLIVSYANFWTSAGQSLLSLVEEFSSFSSQSCKKCTLHKQDFNVELPEISGQFLNCVSDLIPKVWHFLSEEGRFLVLVKDPIDFRWIGSMGFSILAPDNASSELKSNAETESVDSTYVKKCLFQVGFHCVLYGSFLSSLCSGQQIIP